MEMAATILHADLDAFYASVEQLLDPSLRGKPIAVGGGVVLAASYEAKAFGVSGGMPGRRARELCPELIFVDGHFREYQRLGDAPISVGVARTKHLAKIASQVAKPDGLVVVDPGTELAFLHDLPVDLMWGVGPATRARLAERGIATIGDLAKSFPGALARLLGRAAGEKLG